tara:strand:- start:2958 stop:4205 length:1248 start_codon:yes stop_codon:yes gene_type:complete
MVPKGWEVCPLSEITKWSSGGTPSKSNKEYWNGDIPWISASSMKGHYYSDSDLKITELAVSEKAKMADKNNILLLVRGSMLWNKIPVGITTRRVAFNQDVKCISPTLSKLDTDFLLYWFLAKENQLMGMVTGTGIGAGKLDTNDLQSLSVLLPPLPEQQKIANILSTWDKAISTTERLIDNSTQQKKALMQQLLTGKKRLLDDNGERFSGKWELKKVSDYFDVSSSKRVLQEDWKEDGVPFYRTRELVSLAKNEPFRSSIYIADDYYEELIAKYGMPDEGDFLVSGVGTLGIIYQVRENDKFYFKDGNVLWFRKEKEVSSDFFKYCFLSDYIQNQINIQASVTTVGTYTITNAKKTKFHCPPLEEQQKIATVLTNADKEIELLEQQLVDLQQEKKALMQVLLTGKKRVLVDGESV